MLYFEPTKDFLSLLIRKENGTMLIVSRRAKQTLIINDDIEITVLSVAGKQVRLGVEAPKDVKIYRKELYEKINGDKKDKDEHKEVS